MYRLLILTLALASPAAWPQAEEAEPSVEEAPTQTESADDTATDSDPFDYEASEQISEDLSVSFPVDI